MKTLLLVLTSCFLAGCGFQSSTGTINYLAALNPTTRTLSISGQHIGTIQSLESAIPNRDDQLMINHFIANDADITTVDPNAFIFLENLATLDLSDNDIKEFGIASSSLNDIHLSDNELTLVDLSEVKSAHNIWLDKNNFSKMEDIHLPSEVLNLSLADNDITDVAGLAQYKLLRILDLSHNPLNAAAIENLKKIPQLAQVTLTGSVSPEQEKALQDWLDLRAAGKVK